MVIAGAGVAGVDGTLLMNTLNAPMTGLAAIKTSQVPPVMWLRDAMNPNVPAGVIQEGAGQEGVLLPKNPKPDPAPEDQPVTPQNVTPMQHAVVGVEEVEVEVAEVEEALIYTLTPIRLIRDLLLL